MLRHDLAIPNTARGMGVRVVGSKGSGKSRLIGRTIVYSDFVQHIPSVIIDPTQGLINNTLDKIIRLPTNQQRELWPRVRYINMAGDFDTKDAMRVVPFPIMYPARTPYEASQRYVDVVRRSDSNLASASIQGLNALARIATDVNMLLSALGWQLSEAEALITNAKHYEAQLKGAVAQHPDVAGAAQFLLEEFPRMRPQEQQILTGSFLTKIGVFSRDPISRAMYCANAQAFSWQDVVEKDLLVLFDFSRVPDTQKQFALLWIYHSFVEWVRRERGTGRHKPLSFVIDELTFMLGSATARDDIMAHDLNQLINVIARNASLWVTLSHQEISQLAKPVQDTLATIGTQIYGSTTDPFTAQVVARRFYPYIPNKSKRDEKVWGSDMGYHYVIDTRQVDYSIPEQLELNSRALLELPAFHFLVGISEREGTQPTSLQHMTIEDLDKDEWPQEHILPTVRASLMERDGRLLSDVLAEIDGRMKPKPPIVESDAASTQQPTAPVHAPALPVEKPIAPKFSRRNKPAS